MRRLPLSLTLVAATLGAALVLPLSPADAKRPPLEIGIQDDPLFVRQPNQYGGRGTKGLISRERAYRAARSLSVRVLRINVIWKWVAKTRAQDGWDWSWYDRAVDAATAHGVSPQLTLTGPAPAWATGNGKPGPVRPDARQFGEFVAAAAARYRGWVTRYAIWNEPNWPSWLSPQSKAPGIYRRLYLAAYAAIEREDPAAQVLIGELAPLGPPEAATPPLHFLRGLTCRDRDWHARRTCAPLYADGFAHHPYALRWPPEYRGPSRDDVTMGSLGRLTYVLRLLARRHALSTPAGRAPPIYLTEFGYHANSRTILEPERARFTLRAFDIAARDPHVRQIVWYQLAQPPHSPNRQWDTALLRRGGVARPTFTALVRWLRDAVEAGRVAAPRAAAARASRPGP
jgi:hypothetical protein